MYIIYTLWKSRCLFAHSKTHVHYLHTLKITVLVCLLTLRHMYIIYTLWKSRCLFAHSKTHVRYLHTLKITGLVCSLQDTCTLSTHSGDPFPSPPPFPCFSPGKVRPRQRVSWSWWRQWRLAPPPSPPAPSWGWRSWAQWSLGRSCRPGVSVSPPPWQLRTQFCLWKERQDHIMKWKERMWRIHS